MELLKMVFVYYVDFPFDLYNFKTRTLFFNTYRYSFDIYVQNYVLITVSNSDGQLINM